MRTLIHLLFTALFFFIISKVSEDSYNTAIYGVFVLVIGYLLFILMEQAYIYKTKKELVCEGAVISATKQDQDSGYNIEVKFTSPYSNKEYIIQSKVTVLPANNKVEVILNLKKTEKSKIYVETSNWQLSLLILGGLFFLYKFLHSLSI